MKLNPETKAALVLMLIMVTTDAMAQGAPRRVAFLTITRSFRQKTSLPRSAW